MRAGNANRHHAGMTSIDNPARAAVEVTLMGGFGVSVDGVPTASRGWARRDTAALVKVLALAPGHHLHREHVMDLLWPDEPPALCAPRLHKAAHYARRAAGRHDAIVLRNDVVWLFPGAEVAVDAIRFEQLARVAVAEGDAHVAHDALACYRGELLPGDRYEAWAADRRELLHLRRLDVLRVAGEWRELAELDQTDEEANVHLIRRHLAAGDAAAAIRQYEHLERTLERELDATPGSAARRARLEAGQLADRQAGTGTVTDVGALLAELAALVDRQHAVLADLAAVGAAPPLG
jgi:DNA-binding SARP family transcriptional activator